jgi:hypothetical protein
MQQVAAGEVARGMMAARVTMSGECVKGFGDEIAVCGETKKDRQRQKRFLGEEEYGLRSGLLRSSGKSAFGRNDRVCGG